MCLYEGRHWFMFDFSLDLSYLNLFIANFQSWNSRSDLRFYRTVFSSDRDKKTGGWMDNDGRKINNSKEAKLDFTIGSPQGSSLVPSLFLIIINEFKKRFEFIQRLINSSTWKIYRQKSENKKGTSLTLASDCFILRSTYATMEKDSYTQSH